MNPHFWIIFVRGHKRWGWSALGTARGGLDIQAYRTVKAAGPDLYRARQLYGKGNVRLYKYRPEALPVRQEADPTREMKLRARVLKASMLIAGTTQGRIAGSLAYIGRSYGIPELETGGEQKVAHALEARSLLQDAEWRGIVGPVLALADRTLTELSEKAEDDLSAERRRDIVAGCVLLSGFSIEEMAWNVSRLAGRRYLGGRLETEPLQTLKSCDGLTAEEWQVIKLAILGLARRTLKQETQLTA